MFSACERLSIPPMAYDRVIVEVAVNDGLVRISVVAPDDCRKAASDV